MLLAFSLSKTIHIYIQNVCGGIMVVEGVEGLDLVVNTSWSHIRLRFFAPLHYTNSANKFQRRAPAGLINM